MKKLSTIMLLFSFMSVLNSCQQNFNEENAVTPSKNLSVTDAKSWFENQFTTNRLSTVGLMDKVFWNLAFEHKFPVNDETYIIVPLARYSEKEKFATGNYKQLWIYKDSDDKMNLRVIEYIYDSAIPLKSIGDYSLKNFKGTMVVRDWTTNKVLGGFICEDGKLRKGLYPQNSSDAKARPATFFCGPSTSYVYGYNYSTQPEASAPYYWSYSYTTFSCVWIEALYSTFAYANAMDVQIPQVSVSTAEVGGSPTGWSSTYDMKFQVMGSQCEGMVEMLTAQRLENKEMLGVITTDNKIVILPSSGNTQFNFNFTTNVLHMDLVGRPLIYVDTDHNEVTVYYYQTPDSKPTSTSTFKITGFIHSHPVDDDHYWNDPSLEDKTMAQTYPSLEHYLVNRINVIKYNGTGTTGSTANLYCVGPGN